MKLADLYASVFGEWKDRLAPPFFKNDAGLEPISFWVESGVAAVAVYKTALVFKAVSLSRCPVASYDSWKVKRVDIDAAIDFIESKGVVVDPVLKPLLQAKRGDFVCEIRLREVSWHSMTQWNDKNSMTQWNDKKREGSWYDHSSTAYRFFKRASEKDFVIYRSRYVDADWLKGNPLFKKGDRNVLLEFIDDYNKSIHSAEKEKRKSGEKSVFMVRDADLPDDVKRFIEKKGMLMSV
jgi:hypothetical protein